MELGMVSIQRNRGPWLAEWFAFHYLVGFRRFYFYAHLCTDDTAEIIQRMAAKINIQPFFIADKMDRVQLCAYQHACENFMDEVDWMAFIDGDEFLFPTEADTMQEALLPYADLPISAIAVYNVTFGSSGHLLEPKGLITENFRRCNASPDFRPNRRVKSIVKGHQRVSTSGCSNFFVTESNTIDEQHRPVNWGYMENYVPSYDSFRFNHYPCQSYEFFKSFKSGSGHADAGASTVRDAEWWNNFDQNGEFDASLCRFNADLHRTIAWLMSP